MNEFDIIKAYGKVCGFNYIAKDFNGGVYFYEDKPFKTLGMWDTDRGRVSRVHWDPEEISWEDEEPFKI